MYRRLTAVFALGALAALAAGPAAAGTAANAPKPAATPLKTITHIHTSPLCTALGRVIGPAIAKVLQSDKVIASSKPLFHDYVKDTAAAQNKAAQDLDVSRLERLIGPLVKNTQNVDRLLNDPYAFPQVAYSSDDQELLKMRAQLRRVNEQQKKALDVISGFVDTEQLGELQAEGHRYAAALSSNPKPQQPESASPTDPPADVLNAGVSNTKNDPSRAANPEYKNSSSLVGANPLNVFENAISSYQQEIAGSEKAAAKSVVQAVPACGGHVPGHPEPVPSPSP